MALLTDGLISVLEDLQTLDSAVFETAENERVDLDTKLKLAEERIGLEIASFLLRTRASAIQRASDGSYDLSHVVVTPSVQGWHTLQTLAEVYSDVYNSQFNDRFHGKWKHFQDQARHAQNLAFELGIGIVDNPVGRPNQPSVFGNGSGGPVAGYLVQVAWRTQADEASAPSEAVSFNASNGEPITVQPPQAPSGVTGYDVFVAMDGQPPARQNPIPIAAGTPWIMPVTGVVPGPVPSAGQAPRYFVRRNRTL